MSTLLMEIQPTAKIYADILSDILKMVISIVDENMNRVAGSNRYMSKQMHSRANVAHESGIMAKAMQSGQIQVVESPRNDEACRNCPAYNCCIEMYNISIPIVVNKRVYGGIAIIAMTEQQRKRAIKNKELYSTFLQQFAGLLALKIQEELLRRSDHNVIKMLDRIIEKVEIGVIAFRASGEIVLINSIGRSILDIDLEDLPLKAQIEVRGNSDGAYEYDLSVKNKIYQLTGTFHPINLDEYSDVLLFQRKQLEGLPQSFLPSSANKGVNRIYGVSTKITNVKTKIFQFSHSSSPILICGENGTEKTEVAMAIHEVGNRAEAPFIVFNCMTTLPEMVNRVLFGVSGKNGGKGKTGYLDAASKGILVLENVDCLPLNAQARILKVLEEGTYTRINSLHVIRSDTRIIATTEKDMFRLIKKRCFLEPLFYRLNILQIVVPPLRERGEDIVVLAKAELKKITQKLNYSIVSVDPEFWTQIKKHNWPGNIWELRNKIEYAVNVAGDGGSITSDLLEQMDLNYDTFLQQENFCLSDIEKKTIKKALLYFGTSMKGKERAAKELGIGIATLYRKIQEYHLLDEIEIK